MLEKEENQLSYEISKISKLWTCADMRNCGDCLIRESWSHGGLFMILLTLQGYYGNPSANQANRFIPD